MRKITYILSVLIIVTSCSKEDNKICFTPPAPILLRFINADGTDLLDPGNENSYKTEDIRISYVDKGVSRQASVSISNINTAGDYFLTTDISWFAEKGQAFFVRLSATDTDTIYLSQPKRNEDGCTFFPTELFKYNNTQLELTMEIPLELYVYRIVK